MHKEIVPILLKMYDYEENDLISLDSFLRIKIDHGFFGLDKRKAKKLKNFLNTNEIIYESVDYSFFTTFYIFFRMCKKGLLVSLLKRINKIVEE